VNNKFIKTKNHKIIIFFSKAPHTYYQWLFSIFCFPFIFKINFGFKIEFQLELSSFFTQAKKFILLSLVFSFFLVYFLIWSNNDEIWVRSECFFYFYCNLAFKLFLLEILYTIIYTKKQSFIIKKWKSRNDYFRFGLVFIKKNN
jgi:hypothetical protein